MTVADTIRLTPDEITALSSEQIQELPTILDVLEYLSGIENVGMQSMLDNQVPWLDFNKEGYYEWVSDKPWTNESKLMPLSKTPFLLMRGQNSYYRHCAPSLYRNQSKMTPDEFKTISRVRTAEFILSYKDHPVIQDLRTKCVVEDLAIAQHYGFPTEYLDITNNKWVAAFFATTLCENDVYRLVETGFGQGYGVLYVVRSNADFLQPDMQDRLRALGFQYFQRPTRQNTMVYAMEEGENFDANPAFNRIIFRHDTEASKLVYEYSMRQERYFPKDNLAGLAQSIREPEYKVSKGAIALSHKLGVNATDEEICALLNHFGMGYTDNMEPIAHFPEEIVRQEQKAWNEYDRVYLHRHIMPIVPVYKI